MDQGKGYIADGYSANDAAWHSDHHNFEQHYHQYLRDLRKKPNLSGLSGMIPLRPISPIFPPVTPVPPIGTITPEQPEIPVPPTLPTPVPPIETVPPIPPIGTAPPAAYKRPRNIPANILVRMQEAIDDTESATRSLKFLAGQSRLGNLREALNRLAMRQGRALILAKTFFRDVTGLRPLDYAPDGEDRAAPGEVVLRRLVLDLRALLEKLRDLSRWFARFGAAHRLDEIAKIVASVAGEAEKMTK